MSRQRAGILILAAVLSCGWPIPATTAAPVPQADSQAPSVSLELVSNQLDQPVYLTHAGDGSGRLFVAEKAGRVVVLEAGVVLPSPLLDIRALVRSSGEEQGMLGLAFHPSFSSNGRFFVSYTDRAGNVVIAAYRLSSTGAAEPDSAGRLLYIEKSTARHNGGTLAFGPDGYLYAGLGDGGWVNPSVDVADSAQNKALLLGKLLRLDVDSATPYGIPADNPFVNEPGSRPEIWAFGLRNPWRFSFDRATGDLYIADVGRRQWEEVNFQPAGSGGGQNYGWNRMEGRHCFEAFRNCDPSAFVLPIAEYDHSLGCAIIGGHVYRGAGFPQLGGLYFYADFCSGRLWSLAQRAPGDWQQRELLRTSLLISSFGEDEAGEVYLTSLSDNGLYRLMAPSSAVR
jgi:glucose/arabinose dehydrogenase